MVALLCEGMATEAYEVIAKHMDAEWSTASSETLGDSEFERIRGRRLAGEVHAEPRRFGATNGAFESSIQ